MTSRGFKMEKLQFNANVQFRIPINYKKMQEYGLTVYQVKEIVGEPEIVKKFIADMKVSIGKKATKKKAVVPKASIGEVEYDD